MLKTKTKRMPIVKFHYADTSRIPLRNKKEAKDFILKLFQAEEREVATLNYIFCSDEYLLDINRTHLKHDYFTDIITFDLSDNPSIIIGEIYISVPRVIENAAIHKTTSANELLRVIFHGALHLCGYRDKKKSEITIMREKENEYLRLFEEKK
jgi:probable rRNA maturation factor